jgi:hypothetical protein
MGAMAGGAALGVGAGLVGGALVADAIGDHNEDMYEQGYGEWFFPSPVYGLRGVELTFDKTDAGQMDDGGGGDFAGDFDGGGDF